MTKTFRGTKLLIGVSCDLDVFGLSMLWAWDYKMLEIRFLWFGFYIGAASVWD
jgi:hypothetical protein